MLRKLAGLLVAVVLGVTATVFVAAPAHATVVTFVLGGQWSTGYVGDFVVVNNTAAPISGWGIVYDLAPTTTVTSMWNGTQVASTPHFVIVGLSWNAVIAPGATVRVGILAVGADLPVVL